jgi:hypothetical protein
VIETVAGLALAVLAGCCIRVALIIWPPRGAKLPDPATVPGMPMAGPASQQAAHAALTGKRRI